jgi:hypothetical protein
MHGRKHLAGPPKIQTPLFQGLVTLDRVKVIRTRFILLRRKTSAFRPRISGGL